MSGGQRFKRDVALTRAQELIEQLRSACERIEIAGSLRRGMASVGDIEIVALPKVAEHAVAVQLSLFGDATPARIERVSLLDEALVEIVAAGELVRERPHAADRPAWGDKYKKLWAKVQTDDGLAYIQVDLFIVVPPAQWGPIFTLRTGPDEFSRWLVTQRRKGGAMPSNMHQVKGTLWRGPDVEVLVPTEQDYFAALGVVYIEPHLRDDRANWQMLTPEHYPQGLQYGQR